MAFYESKWLNEYNLNKPKFYLRFVDGILAAFDKEQNSLNFLNFLNKIHPNIKFTIDKQVNHSIGFIIKVSHFKDVTNPPMRDFF